MEKTVQDLLSRTVLNKHTGCMEWQGAITKSTGYGAVKHRGKKCDTHRLIWILINGDPAPGMQVCHTCDNRSCINPEHLFLGTNSDNMRDAAKKGRLAKNGFLSGEEHPLSKLTADIVREVRRLPKEGMNIAELARSYGVSREVLSLAIRGKTWKNI